MLKVKYNVFGQLGNNCYLITDEKTNKSALVDCADASQKMLDFIGDADLEYILLTHGHFDHIGGVPEIKEKLGAKIVIGAEDAVMLKSGRHSLAAFCGQKQVPIEADILVCNGDTITLGETEIKVMETPGHTKGGVCYITDDIIFSGDTLFHCSCGRTDFPGGSVAEIKESLNKLASLDGDYKVYAGHDSETTLDYERKYNPYMR